MEELNSIILYRATPCFKKKKCLLILNVTEADVTECALREICIARGVLRFLETPQVTDVILLASPNNASREYTLAERNVQRM